MTELPILNRSEIRAAREAAGLTREAVADKVGIDTLNLGMMEDVYTVRPTKDLLRKLTNLYGSQHGPRWQALSAAIHTVPMDGDASIDIGDRQANSCWNRAAENMSRYRERVQVLIDKEVREND